MFTVKISYRNVEWNKICININVAFISFIFNCSIYSYFEWAFIISRFTFSLGFSIYVLLSFIVYIFFI